MALGGTLAWWLAGELGATRPIFAALIPLVAMTGDPFAAVSVSVGRILGVFGGVALGIAFVHVDLGSTTRIAVVLLIASIGAMVLKVGTRPNLEVPIAALFMLGFASANVSELGIQRIWETALGACVAVVVSSLLWPPDPARELTRRLGSLRTAVVGDLTAVAEDLATASGTTAAHLDDVREHSLDAVRNVFALDAAHGALRWNPLRRRNAPEVAELSDRIHLAGRVYRHTRALARDVADARLHDPELGEATRHLADAADRALRLTDPSAPLHRAATLLEPDRDGEARVVAAQLRQLLADLRAGAMRQEP